ncbi:MAG: NAD(P)/FAD-dependent oxidoreductase, partial [Pseudomonadota bacterium]
MHHVIVGGGQAAVSAAAKLRALDDAASITIISEESVLPYQRPPLSKAYLSGEMPLDRLQLRPREWYDEAGVDIRLGTRAENLDLDTQTVQTTDGDVPFDRLLIATGTRVRRLPEGLGDDLAGVHYLRTTADIDAMAPQMGEGRKLVIVGGGYIGLEVAAVARKRAMSVVVLEVADRILQRVASQETSDYFRNLHTSHGVVLMEGQGLERFEGDERLERVRLSDDTVLDADMALVGIGVVPNDELARGAGIACDNGITVDAHCRTS